MKLKTNKKLFDEYAWKARVLPAFIAIMPVILTVLILGYFDAIVTLSSLLGGLGAVFLISQITRTLGRKLEKRLCVLWHGMPTTSLLRYSTIQNNALFNRRRAKLSAVIGERLPSRRKENANPAEADEIYIAATRMLINKVGRQKSSFPRVHEENINYGFRRNLLALKPISLLLLLLNVIIAIVTVFYGHNGIQGCLILLATALSVFVWIMITPSWVKDAADVYAERLFDTLDSGGQ